jgi:hypothetical protein
MSERYWQFKYRHYRTMALSFGFFSVFWALLLFAIHDDTFAFALGLFVVMASAFTAGRWHAMMVYVADLPMRAADPARVESKGA